MTLQPFYAAEKCGAHFTWHVVGRGDYTAQVASIVGIQQRIDFNGGLETPQITITLGGSGLWGGDVPGDVLVVFLVSDNDNETVFFPCVTIQSIDIIEDSTGQKITTIKGAGSTVGVIPDDYNFYLVTAEEPRALAVKWIKAASGTLGYLSPPAYTDSYQRSLSRVAAPAATLAGLAGFSDTTPQTRIRKGNAQDTSTWTGAWTTVTGVGPCSDIQWSAAPGLPDNRACLGRIPLYWHQTGQYLRVIWTARKTFPAVTGQKVQYPLGAIEGLYVNLITAGGTNYQGTVYLSNHYLTPNTTEDIEITYKSRKEAKDFYRQNAAKLAPGPDYGWGFATYTSGPQSDIKRWGGSKTVKITNVAQYTGTLASYYTAAKAAVAPGAPALDYAPGEATSMGEITLCENGNPVNYDNQRFIAQAQIQHLPQRMDSGWQAAGISSYTDLSEGYQVEQRLHPITISQEYTTRALMQQACFLGSIGLYDSADPLAIVDTCPEGGVVFNKALRIFYVAEVTQAGDYPMPAGYDLQVKTPDNQSYTFHVEDSKGTAANMSLNLLQGTVQGWQTAAQSGGYEYLSLSSTIWQDNPGGLVDRWTGSNVSGGNLAGFTALSAPYADRGAALIDAAGTLHDWTTNISNYSGAAKYAVRGLDGTEYQLFCSVANLGIDSPLEGGKQSAPYLDVFPLLSFLKAHGRAYKDNYNRQSYRVRTTMVFASAKPGDVLALELPQIFNGQKCLAIVVSISISTDSFPELEIVPMHIITSDDYNNFSNLGNVI